MNDISKQYFNWLCYTVTTGRPRYKTSYSKLLRYLYDVDFTYTIDRDGNRYEDGINLRYIFGQIEHKDQRAVAFVLDSKPCSVLEMMVGLACRCEDQIMSNSRYGNRSGEWFWDMVKSLGLYDMTDNKFSESKASSIINRFLNREYEPTGHGGLFSIEVVDDYGNIVDLTTQEIWYQAMWYLNGILEEGGNS